MRRSLRSIALAAGLALPLIAAAAPAFAKPLVHEPFSGTDSGTECGSYERQTTFSGWTMIKDATPATDGQFFYFQSHFQYTDVITNPETGAFFTVSGSTFNKESQARQVEGDIYTYSSLEIGQPFVIRDMDGRVVLRDVGLIAFVITFDTLGDSAPGGEDFQEESFRVAGPHPGFEETFDFCAIADQLIGSPEQ